MPEKYRSAPPRYIVLWRKGDENGWEAVPDRKMVPFLRELVELRGVDPASIFITTQCSWMFPEQHRGKRTVWLNEFFDEINGSGVPAPYKGPDVKSEPAKEEDLFGFISPDGRCFRCGYGGHSMLAKTIVGSLQKVDDAQKYLEDHGWLVIYHDPTGRGAKYAVGMGRGKTVSDDQIRAIERMGLPLNTMGLDLLLEA